MPRVRRAALALAAVVLAGSQADLVAQERFAETNGIRIAYESYGAADRETILLIMGAGAQLTQWPGELVQALVEHGYRVIRFDNRDAGLSTHLDDLGRPDWAAITEAAEVGRPIPLPYTLHDMVDDTIGLMDALEVDQAHLVGASMGGNIAQLIAVHHPARVLSLTSLASDTGNPEAPAPTDEVLAIPPPPPAGTPIDELIEREVTARRTLGSPKYPTPDARLREDIRRDIERSYDPAGLERHAAAVMFAGDRRDQLRNLDVPTVVVHGDADPLVPLGNGVETAATIPGAELRVIPGMGHDIPSALVPQIADAIVAAASAAGKRAPR